MRKEQIAGQRLGPLEVDEKDSLGKVQSLPQRPNPTTITTNVYPGSISYECITDQLLLQARGLFSPLSETP